MRTRNSVKCKTLSKSSLYLLFFLKTTLISTPVLRKQVILAQMTCSANGDFVGLILHFSRQQLCGIKATSAKPGPQSDNIECHKFMLLTTWRPL